MDAFDPVYICIILSCISRCTMNTILWLFLLNLGPSWSWWIHMIAGVTKTRAISVYFHKNCEFESCSCQGVLDATLCDKVCQWFKADRWFSSGIPVSSSNKNEHHNITEILLKVALSTITGKALTLGRFTSIYIIRVIHHQVLRFPLP